MESFIRRLKLTFLAAVVAAISFLAGGTAEALDPSRSIAQFHHTAWSQPDGMPGNIRAIAQTTDGFLWLGTDGGLFRFDGVRVERIDHFGETKLPLVSVEALLGTPDGDLWIAFRDDSPMLGRVRSNVLTMHTRAEGLPDGTVSQIVAGADNGVWVRTIAEFTTEAVAHFDGKAWRTIEGEFGSRLKERGGGVWDLAVAADGTTWAKNGYTLFYYRSGMARFEKAPGYFGRTLGFARARDGRVWTADSDQRRFYFAPDMSQQPGSDAPPPALGLPVPQGFGGFILLDRDGTMWCANQIAGGVSRIRSLDPSAAAIAEQFNVPDGLSSDVTLSIFEDREGNVWVGTNGGLDRFRPADVVTETRVPLGASPSIRTNDEALYIFTGALRNSDGDPNESAIFRIGPDGEPKAVATQAGAIQQFAVEGKDVLFERVDAAGKRTRYALRNGDQLEETPLPPRPADMASGGFVSTTYGGDSYYARPGVGFYRFHNGVETQLVAKTTPEAPRLMQEWQGRFWVYYTDGTLFEIEGDQVREHSSPDMASMHTLNMNDQRMLFGGQHGLVDWNGKAFRALPASRVPALSTVSALVFGRDGEIWLATQSGLLRTTTADLDRALADPHAPVSYRLFDHRDGLKGAVNADMFGREMSVGLDGRLWFATSAGLTWINPAHIARNAMPPSVVVTSLRTGETVHEMPADLKLPPGSSNLQIDYTGLSLAVPERNRFRYRLEGVDSDWVDAGDRRQVFYTRLEPGSYRFHVAGSNNDGVWNEEGATLGFTIEPTFLQSIWFKLLIAVGAAGLAWLAWTLRLRQQAVHLQNRFEVRIAERERIARELHDTLLQGIQGLILRFQAIANRAPVGSDLRAPIDDAIDRADAVMAEGRIRVRELRATAEDGDLAKAIVDIASDAVSGDTPRFALTIEGTPRALHALVGEELLRIAEEAIRNAARHANAKTIDAILSYGRGELLMTIRDDGVGLSSAILATGEKQGHFGLTGMRERAERIGGRLNVTSRAGAGTEITLTVPRAAAYNRRGRA